MAFEMEKQRAVFSDKRNFLSPIRANVVTTKVQFFSGGKKMTPDVPRQSASCIR
jgi:hypothetical protein